MSLNRTEYVVNLGAVNINFFRHDPLRQTAWAEDLAAAVLLAQLGDLCRRTGSATVT
ncbi:MAG: hypothetical protein WBF42_02815 [Terracidiphilus sp.]